MAKLPEKKTPSPAQGGAPKRRSPLTDFLDAAEPLERGGFSEAPQADFEGAPLTGSISDWAGQIEREAEKQPKAKAPKKIPERSSAPGRTARAR